MPPAAFADLWRTLQAGRPWVGLVKNRRKDGDHYWVEAHVTPCFENGEHVGYMSVRKKVGRKRIATANRDYASMRAGEGALRIRHGASIRFLFVKPALCLQLDRHGWRKCRFCRSKNLPFRFRLATDTLAVRLHPFPLPGGSRTFTFKSSQSPPQRSRQRQSRRYAPCLAHQKKRAVYGAFRLQRGFPLRA